ncbi:MAG: PEP-CTERM sorting domain-containing protein [Planctomycetota bacterium]
MRYLLATTIALNGFAGPALAATTFDNGLANELAGQHGQVIVTNGTTLLTLAGSSATGGNGEPGLTLDEDSRVTLENTVIQGGRNDFGILGDTGTLRVISGDVIGGDAGTGFAARAGEGIFATFTDVTIEGGTVTGGNGADSGFGSSLQGAAAFSLSSGSFQISGGSFSAGTTTGGFGPLAVVAINQSNGSISGGTFNGDADANVLNLTGSFDPDADVQAMISISGGTFPAGGDWTILGNIVVNVFGSDLDITDNNLTGTLADGTPLDVELNLSSGGTVNLVPEPTSLALLGLGGLLVARRRA